MLHRSPETGRRLARTAPSLQERLPFFLTIVARRFFLSAANLSAEDLAADFFASLHSANSLFPSAARSSAVASRKNWCRPASATATNSRRKRQMLRFEVSAGLR